MKKIISVFLAISFFVTSFNIITYSANSITYFVNEDFNAVSTGSLPSSMSFSAKSNRLSVVEKPSKTDKSLKYDMITSSDSFIDVSFGTQDTKFIFEFDIMFENIGDGTFAVFFKDSQYAETEMMHFDKNYNLCSADGSIICRCSAGKFYKICAVISPDTCRADIYVNHKERAKEMLVGNANFKDVSIIRLHEYNVGDGEKPILYVDNIKAYKNDKPIFKIEDDEEVSISMDSVASDLASDSEVAMYMGNSLAFFVGKSKMYADGTVAYVDSENTDVKPFIENDRTFVPIRTVSEAFGATVDWDSEKKAIDISLGESHICMNVGNKTYSVSGVSKEMDVAPMIKDDRTFVPLRAVSEAFGKKVTYDKSGLIVIGDKENFFNMRNDIGIFRNLAGQLVYTNPSGSELCDIISSRYPQKEHPRLMANKNDIDIIIDRINTSDIYKQWYEDIITSADNLLDKEPCTYSIPDGVRLQANEPKARLQLLSVAYQLSKDEKYAKRCVEELDAACEFKDWNPNHFLDTATMMSGVAFAYDWLYNYLSDSQREKYVNTIYKKGLTQILEDYDDVPDRKRTWKWAQSTVPDNWNIVCNSGALIASIAVCDDIPECAARVFDGGMELIKKAILMYGPDGSWYEGTGYWGYATGNLTEFLSSLMTACGETYGYMDVPGMAQTCYFINDLTGPQGSFNFHDSAEEKTNSPETFFFANILKDGGLMNLRINQMKERKYIGTWRDILWYNPDLTVESSNLKYDNYYRDTEVVTMRNSRNESSGIYLGLHAGKTNVYHGHMDAGSFVLDGYGNRFVCDLGLENYNIPDSVWNLYRYRAEGHNTLVFNPANSGGQSLAGTSLFDKFETNSNGAFAVTDLSSMYDEYATSVRRGFKLTNNRNAVIIQDEIKSEKPNNIMWFMHTKRDIVISDDKKSAILKGDYMNLLVTLVEDIDGSFSVMDASPMESSPKNSMQNKNNGFHKLAFTANNFKDGTISVMMQFVLPNQGFDDKAYTEKLVPLDNWELDNNVYPVKPTLTDIKLNGQLIENFDSENYVYTYKLNDDETIPHVTAEGEGKVSIENISGNPSYCVITVTSDEEYCSKYIIRFMQPMAKKTAPTGELQLDVVGVNASQVPQEENSPENTLDNDLDTRWSAQGEAYITYELSDIKTIKYVGMAVYQESSDGRRQFFDIQISEDGEDFETVFSGESSGTTLDEEYFEIPESRAKYVRINAKGTSLGNWNSITEVKVYGK